MKGRTGLAESVAKGGCCCASASVLSGMEGEANAVTAILGSGKAMPSGSARVFRPSKPESSATCAGVGGYLLVIHLLSMNWRPLWICGGCRVPECWY